ncbi:DUF1573 domain-containing protein [bacterium]|nr:DUF1573 domain-containing protein [candidate division CSSED10-310 bacterium]
MMRIFKVFAMLCTILFMVPGMFNANIQAEDTNKIGVQAAEAVKTVPDKTEGQSKIEFESVVHDFGTHVSGVDLEHDFIFHNRGTVNLIIERVKAG